MNQRSGCLVCGKELVYHESTIDLSCYYCQQTFSSDVHCIDGHYICDDCHRAPALEVIERYVINSISTDPLQMALEVMKHPSVKMHGPEHHFLVPAVLLAAFYNIQGNVNEKKRRIGVARSRAEKLPGGFCGSHGNCAAGVGAGIFVSIVTGATPTAKEAWKLSNMVTAKSLHTIAEHGGPRCCKRNTYLAIREATKFVNRHFNVRMTVPYDVRCEFNEMNKECLKTECPFFEENGQSPSTL